MRIAFDTNVVGYAEGLDDAVRCRQARDLLVELQSHALVMPVQVAAELHRLVMRRSRVDAGQARIVVERWANALPFRPPTTVQTWEAALDLAAEHRLQIFDAIVLAVSAEAGCSLLLSEDMQDGFVWRGLTVVNPFAGKLHPLLADLLGRARSGSASVRR